MDLISRNRTQPSDPQMHEGIKEKEYRNTKQNDKYIYICLYISPASFICHLYVYNIGYILYIHVCCIYYTYYIHATFMFECEQLHIFAITNGSIIPMPKKEAHQRVFLYKLNILQHFCLIIWAQIINLKMLQTYLHIFNVLITTT